MGKARWVVVLAIVLHAAAASAQQREVPDTEYAFDDDIVRGTTFGPDVEVLQTRRRGARDSLIRARENFVHELLKSVEDL